MKEKIKNLLENNLINRKVNAHKGSYNKVLIIGGSKEYQGAPLIVAHAALRSGVGQVRMLIHQDNIINFVYPEVTYMEYNEENFVEIINKEFKTIIFGNGSKVTPFYINLLKTLILKYNGNLVIDATGFDILKECGLDILKENRKNNIFITPHIGEFKRLFSIKQNSNDVLDFANDCSILSSKYNIYIFLKSYNCLITYKDSSYIIEGKSPSLAKAGTGDALAGIIGGFLSYIKDVTSTFSVMDIYSENRQEVNTAITKYLDDKLSKEYGIHVSSALIIDVQLDETLQAKVQAKEQAKQDAEKAELDKQTAIAQGEANKAAAEAAAEVQKIQAQGNAEQIKIQAQAQAESNKMLSQSITQELIDMKEAEARVKHGWVTVQNSDAVIADATK